MKLFPNPDVIISLYETAVDTIDPALPGVSAKRLFSFDRAVPGREF